MIRGAQRDDILIESQQVRIVSAQVLLRKVKREVQCGRRSVVDFAIEVERLPGTGIQRSVANRRRRRSVALARGLSLARCDCGDAHPRVARTGAKIEVQTSISLISEDVEVDFLVHSRTGENIQAAI